MLAAAALFLHVGYWIAGPVLLILLFCAYPQSYELARRELVIHDSLTRRRIPYRTIASAEREGRRIRIRYGLGSEIVIAPGGHRGLPGGPRAAHAARPLRRVFLRQAARRVADQLTQVARILFASGLLAGVYDLRFHAEEFGFGRGFEMAAIARSLVATGTFGNPFEPSVTGPTASNPPLYPLILAGLLKAFGPAGTVLVALLLNVGLNAAIAAALPRLSRLFFQRDLPGIFAGVLWILSMRLMPQWDTTMTVAGLIAFCLLSVRDASGLATGLLGGAVSLLNPAAALIFGPWILYLRRSWRYVATVVTIIGACNVPWVVRNYRAFHAPVLRTNFGYTLYSSNNDCAHSTLFFNTRDGCYEKTHPAGSPAEAQLMTDLGEVRYDRLRTSDALAWIESQYRPLP